MDLHHKEGDELNDDDLNIEFEEEMEEHHQGGGGESAYNWDEEFSKNTSTIRDESADFKQLEQIKTTTIVVAPHQHEEEEEEIQSSTVPTTNHNPKANLLSKNEQEDIVEDTEAYESVKKQWDDVQLLREQQQYGQVSNQVSELNTREVNISYQDTIQYYKSLKMKTEYEVAREKLGRSSGGGSSGLGQLFSNCFGGSEGANGEMIRNEKEFLVALTQVPLNHEIEEHERQLFTIYKRITGDRHNCPSIGAHWEAIGFQGNDPKTDLRGVGMLGILQLLFFVYSDEKTTQDIYSLSQTQSFPMAVVSLNITQMILKMLIENKLKSFIKKYDGSVMDAFNISYSSVFYRFYLVWKRGQKRIIDFDNVKKDLIVQVNKNLDEIVKDYTSMVLKREHINVTNKDEIIEFN